MLDCTSYMSLSFAIDISHITTFVEMTTECFIATDYVGYRVTLLEAKREKIKHNTKREQSQR